MCELVKAFRSSHAIDSDLEFQILKQFVLGPVTKQLHWKEARPNVYQSHDPDGRALRLVWRTYPGRPRKVIVCCRNPDQGPRWELWHKKELISVVFCRDNPHLRVLYKVV